MIDGYIFIFAYFSSDLSFNGGSHVIFLSFFPYSLLAELMRKKPSDFVFRGFAGRSHHA